MWLAAAARSWLNSDGDSIRKQLSDRNSQTMHVAQGKVGHESKQENEQYEQEKDKAYTARGRLVPRRLLSRPIIHVYRLVRRKRRVICGLRQRRLVELLLLHVTRLIYAYRSRSGDLPYRAGRM